MVNNGRDTEAVRSLVKRLEGVTDILPQSNFMGVVKDLANAYSEHQRTKREIAAIEANKEVLMKEITEKYATYRLIFERVFAERAAAIRKIFDLIDRGMHDNDRVLITNGLQALSHVVATSPFANIGELRKALDSGQTIEV